MAQIYSKGRPCLPPTVGGVTFTLFDQAHDLWVGAGADSGQDQSSGKVIRLASSRTIALSSESCRSSRSQLVRRV